MRVWRASAAAITAIEAGELLRWLNSKLLCPSCRAVEEETHEAPEAQAEEAEGQVIWPRHLRRALGVDAVDVVLGWHPASIAARIWSV